MQLSKLETQTSLNFTSRKVIQYSLLTCTLLVQIILASFFYTEFSNDKSKKLIDEQMKSVQVIEQLTGNAKNNLSVAQQLLQQYLKTNDNKYLNLYFESLKQFNSNLNSIDDKGRKTINFDKELLSKHTTNIGLQKLIDSTKSLSLDSTPFQPSELPEIQEYFPKFDYSKFEISTKTFSDSTKKKGLFGRLKDAVAGNDSKNKDSVIVTINKTKQEKNLKKSMDSLILSVKNHYVKEIKTIRITEAKNNKSQEKKTANKEQLFLVFNDLFAYSNSLMNAYDTAVSQTKAKLEKEYEIQNSKSTKNRNYLLWGLLFFMFIISLLIIYLTKIAFSYEKKLLDAQELNNENLKFKNRILGMLSHELRSPLKIISIFINRIHKKTNDEEIKNYLKSISFTNNSLLIQANQILEYTKNQQIENKLHISEFNLKTEIDDILYAIEPYIESRKNQLINKLNIPSNLIVNSDKAKLNQLFTNILGNANKFTENGDITVNCTCEILEKSVLFHTKVTDTGVGISKKDIDKILEPYFQGIISEDVDNIGAGLGLSLCKEIVELFHGGLSIKSELHKGTEVSFSLYFDNHIA